MMAIFAAIVAQRVSFATVFLTHEIKGLLVA